MTDQDRAKDKSENEDEPEDHLMTEDEKIDEAGEESFPASDPPAMP